VTRESKLALIIGFVLVLVVGVLVSDHFSQASTMALDVQQPEESASGAVARLGPREKRGLDDSIKNAMGDRAIASGNLSNPPPVIIDNGSDRRSILDRAADEVKQLINTTDFPEAIILGEKDPVQTPIPDLPSRPEDPRATHRVIAGDTLIGIARRALGNGDRWQEIHELNADILGPDAILKIGMTLKLPADAKKATSTSSRSTRSAPASESYTVAPRDTLGEISMKLLGTSRRADEIAELNGLESANDIRVGMKLKIPAR